MTLDTITHRYRCGARLAVRIQEELAAGRATRPALEVERRLAVCRNCDQFRADSCAEIELQPEGPTLCHFLTRQDLHCCRWSAMYDRRHPPRSMFAASEEALQRLHVLGTHRSHAEHQAGRKKKRG